MIVLSALKISPSVFLLYNTPPDNNHWSVPLVPAAPPTPWYEPVNEVIRTTSLFDADDVKVIDVPFVAV